MLFLQKSPKIEDLFIVDKTNSGFPLPFNPPISVPECLSIHLKIFEWQGYGGRKAEKEVVKYILANSTCLITAYISIELTHRRHRGRKKNKMMKELASMSRVSTSSQLIFPTQSSDDWSDFSFFL
ncbi:F-box/FBD/LRR-repeat protein At4g26340-like [Arabidopsis lyrata subsp. lyrata]|uniref:F-box/FBD/LRR-repeat protein At4g26340-like n=1 Tax=Arabidopsis lyrata subsp. lyrata TaxID=81972 RepID=UPI000A29AA30|nr:F-box/FBD/LRR-repeat protein At4g26340-like [Arabidopsis lyrata subsp. lyrata]|eukprot:XP_020885112.1 F-box/FBD/LRR-repeat protein At4g26340-like [Arabidopsis lyrata subsp. lyrata]